MAAWSHIMPEMAEQTFFGCDSDDEALPGADVNIDGLHLGQRKGSEASIATRSTAATPSPIRCEPQQAFREGSVSSSTAWNALARADQGLCELVSEEGRELAEALREAQAALDAARQFVTSPSLRQQPALSGPESVSSELPEEALLQQQLQPQLQPQPQQMSKQRSIPRPSAPPPPRPAPPAPPAVASATAASARSLAAQLGADAAERHRVNALHARFGEAAARARVERAKSLETASRLQKQSEAEAAAEERASAAEVALAQQRRAAKRVASQERTRQDAEREEREQRLLQEQRRVDDRVMGQRFANNAKRRVGSEQSRREALAREVLGSLHVEQAERREACLRKGHELQARCQDADWSHCKSQVESRRRPQPKSMPPATGRQGDADGCGTLPRLNTPRTSSASKERTIRPSSCQRTLPMIAA